MGLLLVRVALIRGELSPLDHLSTTTHHGSVDTILVKYWDRSIRTKSRANIIALFGADLSVLNPQNEGDSHPSFSRAVKRLILAYRVPVPAQDL